MPSPSTSHAGPSSNGPISWPEGQKTTRNRKAYSCTECRRRKKHCDRQVPGCNQCVLRGTVHLCRWGDERDGANHVERPNPAQSKQQSQASSPAEPRRHSGTANERLPSLHESHDFALYHPSRSRSVSPSTTRINDPHQLCGEISAVHADLVSTPSLSHECSMISFISGVNEKASRRNDAVHAEALLREDRRETAGMAGSPTARVTDGTRPAPRRTLYREEHGLSCDDQSLVMKEWTAAEASMGISQQLTPADDQVETPMTSVSSRTSNERRGNGGSERSTKRASEANVTGTTLSAQDDHTSQSSRKRIRRESASSSCPSGPKPILTFTQANELFFLYLSLANRLLIFDQELIADVLKKAMSPQSPYKTDDTIELLHRSPDTYALLLTVCASALSNMPPTYAITMGLIERSDELTSLLNVVSQAASKALETLPGPTFVAIQTHNLFQHNLTAILSVKDHVLLKDRIIREARFLGLDRLGSPEDDEAMWKKRDRIALEKGSSGLPSIDAQGHQARSRNASEQMADAARQLGFGRQGLIDGSDQPSGDFLTPAECPTHLIGQRPWGSDGDVMWAANTFKRRDRNARNLGRCHWMFLRAKDWVTSRLSGCYMIAVDSYTTSLPRPYPGYDKNLITEHDALVFKYLEVALASSRRTTDLVAEAQSMGETVDYDKILELDAELMEALDSRPPELRPEESGSPLAFNGEALFVTSTLWHRVFVLHRPYLIASQTDPERYGLSALRSWDYALLTIKTVREGSKAMTKYWPPLHFRVLQAALVVISHLFIWPHRMTLNQTLAIHDELNWVVNNLKSLGSMNGNASVFAGTSDRLEALLAAASRIKRARGALTTPHDKDCSIGGMAAPWMGGEDGNAAIDLSNSAMQHAAQLASQARMRKGPEIIRPVTAQLERNGAADGSAQSAWTDSLQDIDRSGNYNQWANGNSMSNGQGYLPSLALGALDEQLVRLMGEGTMGWQERIPADSTGAAAFNIGADNQINGMNVDAFGLGSYMGNSTPGSSNAFGTNAGRAPSMAQPVTPGAGHYNSAEWSNNVNGAGGQQQDLWAEIFSYIDAATASLPRPK